jgi:hypothetical protein
MPQFGVAAAGLKGENFYNIGSTMPDIAAEFLEPVLSVELLVRHGKWSMLGILQQRFLTRKKRGFGISEKAPLGISGN